MVAPEVKTFVTVRSTRYEEAPRGPNIHAESQEEADKQATKQGITVVGTLLTY